MKTLNPFTRPYSWSQHSSFLYDPMQWYNKYVLGIETPANPAMEFGSMIGKKLETDPTFLPQVHRYDTMEKKLLGKIDDFSLIGYLDSFCSKTKRGLDEYKTSQNTKRWTQKSAQDHGQILFYLGLIWLNYQIPPEEIESTLWYIPCETGGDFNVRLCDPLNIHSFPVTHTSAEVLQFFNEIKATRKAMKKFSTEESLRKKKSMLA